MPASIVFTLMISAPAPLKPQIEVLPPVSIRHVTTDASDVPAHHFDLMQNAHRVTDTNRDAYFARLRRYIDDAMDCSNPVKLGWFLQLAEYVRGADEVHAVLAPRVDRLILEKPRCFLAGVQNVQLTLAQDKAFAHFVFNTEKSNTAALDAVLQPLIKEAQYRNLAGDYVAQKNVYEAAIARAAAREKRQLAYAQKQYREALQDKQFLHARPDDYWRRWEEQTREARTCKDPEILANVLDAAVLHLDFPQSRRRSAEFVEALAMTNPACMLGGLAIMENRGDLVETYLLQPLHYTALELHGPLAHVPVDGAVKEAQQRYVRAFSRYVNRELPPVKDKAMFLWSVKHVHRDNDGRIYVSPISQGSLAPYRETVDALWAHAPDANIRGTYGRMYKPLPLGTFDTMTRQQFGTYYLMRIDEDRAHVVKARPVKATVAEWYCDGVAPMLQLEPESRPAWLTAGTWPPLVAIELRADLPAPEISAVETDEMLFTRGRITWPSAGRSMDFAYTDGYTDVVFSITDNQTGEEHAGRRVGWSCH